MGDTHAGSTATGSGEPGTRIATPRRDADLAARTRVPLPGALLGVAVHQLYHSRNVAAIVL